MQDNKWVKNLSFAITSGIAFLAVIFIIYFLRYSEPMDAQLFIQFYLIITITGIITIFLSYKKFDFIFFSRVIVGLLADCITTYMQAGHPTMAGGVYNILITIIFCVIAIITQVIYEVKKRRNQAFNSSK